MIVLNLSIMLNCNLFAQRNNEQFLTVNVKNASPVEVFKEIENQSDYRFIYNAASFDDLGHTISLNLNNKSLQEVLSHIKRQVPLKFKQSGYSIAVAVKKPPINQIVISGIITDASTGEHLISANIYNTRTYDGTVSNNYGYYSLKQNAGSIEITCSYLGYKTFSKVIDLTDDHRLDIALEPSLVIEEVIISGSAFDNKVSSSQTSMVKLPLKSLKNLPVLLGETDVIKGLQLMPGVQGGAEGASGMYVRGGSADQNLILLDGVPVYNANHLLGIFSVFNGDALNSVSMYKGGFPARYGGRLSSVVDVRMKEGNTEKVRANATIGLLTSKINIDGPISDKTTFLVSGRRIYYDLLFYPVLFLASKIYPDTKILAVFYFYDFNAKISHRFNKNNRIYLSTYTGVDNYSLKYRYIMNVSYNSDLSEQISIEKMGLKWGNIITSARWNHIFQSDLFSNLTLTYSRFKFKVVEDYFDESKTTDNSFSKRNYYEHFSQIQDLGIDYDFDFIANSNHYLRFGCKGILHLFLPGGLSSGRQSFNDSGSEVVDSVMGTRKIPSLEIHSYIEDDFEVGEKLKFNVGLHYSTFNTDKKFYQSLEPRLSSRYLITENLSFKLSYMTVSQYLMLVTGNALSRPVDVWVPVEGNLRPQRSWQTAGGFNYSLNSNYLFSLEGFYKEMYNVTEYKDGFGIFHLQGDFTKVLTQGYGESYGVELYGRKKTGKTTGWISYTLSWANRRFDDIGGGDPYPYSYDRRHQLNIILEHKINDKWDFGANWIFGTGYPLTISEGTFVSIYDLGHPYRDKIERTTEIIGNRNNYRLSNYHRLDINFNCKKIKKQRERTWSLGVYNTYFHQNPFMVIEEKALGIYKGLNYNRLKELSMLVFVPYFRWCIHFNKIQQQPDEL